MVAYPDPGDVVGVAVDAGRQHAGGHGSRGRPQHRRGRRPGPDIDHGGELDSAGDAVVEEDRHVQRGGVDPYDLARCEDRQFPVRPCGPVGSGPAGHRRAGRVGARSRLRRQPVAGTCRWSRFSGNRTRFAVTGHGFCAGVCQATGSDISLTHRDSTAIDKRSMREGERSCVHMDMSTDTVVGTVRGAAPSVPVSTSGATSRGAAPPSGSSARRSAAAPSVAARSAEGGVAVAAGEGAPR